jgi:hypothetical protein
MSIGRVLSSIVGIVVVLAAATIAIAASKESPEHERGITSTCYPIWLPRYTPRKINGPEDLPPSVRATLLHHLQERLGLAFASRLQPSGGQAVDPQAYFRANPTGDLPAFRYELTFSVVLSQDGPVRHCAKILIDADGTVVEEIALPKCSAVPDKCRVVGLTEALKTAESLGVPVAGAKIQIRYDKRADALDYVVEYTVTVGAESKTMALHIRADDPSQTGWHEVKTYS